MIRRTNGRALAAAGLLAALVAVLLGAWFVSGWRDVRMRQAETGMAPRAAADRRASELARDLRAELDALFAREVRRPYFHYQNLMHDPQTSAGLNVSRSPLAGDADEPLVLGYFQVDAKGRVTTPTVNDDVPELSADAHLAENRAFRDRVARDLARDVAPAERPGAPLAARAGSPPGADMPGPPPRPAPEPAAPSQRTVSQVIQLDPSVYAQNANPNAIYSQQVQAPLAQASLADVRQAPAATPSSGPVTVPIPAEPVTITISPLEWRTLPFAGEPALIAVRQVDTPDRSVTQGFVVDRQALTTWLTARAGGTIPVLRAGDVAAAPVAPGWGLTVEPSPRSLTEAAADSRAIAKGFVTRFAGVAAVAVLAATVVLLLVTRAEYRARERSQFAAAAAHELRTPLAGLQLYGDMLASGLGDPNKVPEYARRMSEDAARLGRVVSNILGFSQLERGNLAIALRTAPVGEILAEIAEQARPALERLGATLELDVARDLRAQFDRDALARIVGNLLDNAEKYSRQSPDRAIGLAATEGGGAVEICVSDRGPGIADSGKLFRAFSRGTSSGDGPAGLGLGLALSRSLARAMGGDLTYRARDGGGATFVLQLRPG